MMWRVAELHAKLYIAMVNDTSFSEIRKHPRLEKKIKGDFRIILPEKGNVRFPLETETISGGGLMFASSHPIREGSHLEFRLFLKDHPVEFTAKAVWTRKQPHSTVVQPLYSTGFQFVIITQEDISKLLRNE